MRAAARHATGWLVALSVLGGCGRATPAPATPSPSATAAAPTAEACTASVPAVDLSAWRLVTAQGFTFCVPPEWRGSGRTWHRGNATISWGLGEPARREVRTELRTVPASQAGSPPAGAPPDSDIRRFAEAIGGRDAQLWRNRFGRAYYTGARWDSPRVWLTGEANGPDAADLEVTIFRTVRFTAP